MSSPATDVQIGRDLELQRVVEWLNRRCECVPFAPCTTCGFIVHELERGVHRESA